MLWPHFAGEKFVAIETLPPSDKLNFRFPWSLFSYTLPPPHPQFQCWSRWFFFCIVSPLSTLRFGGAGGNGAHHTSEVKIITGLDKVKVTHAIYWTIRQYIVDAQGLFVFVSQDSSTLLPPTQPHVVTTFLEQVDNIFSMLRRYLFLSHRIHLIYVSSAFE